MVELEVPHTSLHTMIGLRIRIEAVTDTGLAVVEADSSSNLLLTRDRMILITTMHRGRPRIPQVVSKEDRQEVDTTLPISKVQELVVAVAVVVAASTNVLSKDRGK